MNDFVGKNEHGNVQLALIDAMKSIALIYVPKSTYRNSTALDLIVYT